MALFQNLMSGKVGSILRCQRHAPKHEGCPKKSAARFCCQLKYVILVYLEVACIFHGESNKGMHFDKLNEKSVQNGGQIININ